jgi:hypothetical protein
LGAAGRFHRARPKNGRSHFWPRALMRCGIRSITRPARMTTWRGRRLAAKRWRAGALRALARTRKGVCAHAHRTD